MRSNTEVSGPARVAIAWAIAVPHDKSALPPDSNPCVISVTPARSVLLSRGSQENLRFGSRTALAARTAFARLRTCDMISSSRKTPIEATEPAFQLYLEFYPMLLALVRTAYWPWIIGEIRQENRCPSAYPRQLDTVDLFNVSPSNAYQHNVENAMGIRPSMAI